MSEVVLKRKTHHIKVPISGRGKNGFSLNGGYRNRGAVGTTNLAKSSTRTIYKGAFPVGSGGCCGAFVENILSNNTCCTNDAAIVKRSVMNTNGLILATIKHPTSVFTDCSGSCVKNWVKDFNALNYSQGMFIRTLKIKNICPYWLEAETTTCKLDPETCRPTCTLKWHGHPNTQEVAKCDPNCTNKTYFIGTKKIVRNTTTKNNRKGALESSDYMSGLLQARQCLPPPPCKQPFPMTILHDGCDVNYLTPQQAIDAGALSVDWGHCIGPTHPVYQFNPYLAIDFDSCPTCLVACNVATSPVAAGSVSVTWTNPIRSDGIYDPMKFCIQYREKNISPPGGLSPSIYTIPPEWDSLSPNCNAPVCTLAPWAPIPDTSASNPGTIAGMSPEPHYVRIGTLAADGKTVYMSPWVDFTPP